MAKNIFIDGKYLVLQGISGNVADAQGVASLSVGVNVPDLETAFSLDPAKVAKAVGIQGLLCTSRPISQDQDGEYTIQFQFEGAKDEPPESSIEWSIDADLSDEPIQTHPSFDWMKTFYGWDENKGDFAELLPTASGGAKAVSKAQDTAPKKNPFHGVTSWLSPGVVLSISYATKSVQRSVMENIGTLVSAPPGNYQIRIPKFKNRLWLKMAPHINSNGTAVRVTEKYRLTGPTSGAEWVLYDVSKLELAISSINGSTTAGSYPGLTAWSNLKTPSAGL